MRLATLSLLIIASTLLLGCAGQSDTHAKTKAKATISEDEQTDDQALQDEEATPTPKIIKKKPTPTPEEDEATQIPTKKPKPTPQEELLPEETQAPAEPTKETQLSQEQLDSVKECLEGSSDMLKKINTDIVQVGSSFVPLRTLLAKGYDEENAALKQIRETLPQAQQGYSSPTSSLKQTYGKLLDEYNALISSKTFGSRFKNLYNVLGKGTVRSCKPI